MNRMRNISSRSAGVRMLAIASMFSMARGSAASELAVAKAIEVGSATAWTKRRTGTRARSATGSSTPAMNTATATYIVASSFARFTRMPMPRCPTV